ncbi:amidohydrolase family protein [Flavobacterium sp. N3904]|uniref:amidohydrolase family protein n=1 Tax=Flavobacterium sp. N3904 TaxID=2986835 RepID=UPI00222501EC|nr:amidohydrolase [Flavobacterium sp. N3904]
MALLNPIIDIHHHAIFQSHKANLKLPQWSIESDQEAMERMGISGALLSLPISGPTDVIRKLNTSLADINSFNPKKYGMLASLPMRDIDGALLEIDFAINELNADGFIIPTNYQGIYLGSESLVPILEELNKRNATILVHPTLPAGDNLPTFERDLSVYEYPLETTRSVMDMIYKNRLTQFPNINWIISHAGGTIPYLAYRLSIAGEWQGITQTKEEIINSLQTLYFDLALSTSPSVFSALQHLVSSDNLLFGTDFPLRYEEYVTRSIKEINDYQNFTDSDKSFIFSNTAKSLFTRF